MKATDSMMAEVLSILTLKPLYLRKAEVNPWSRKPLSLVDYVENNSLPTQVFIDGINTESGDVFFCRFRPEWAKTHVDLVILNLDVKWNMREDGSKVNFLASEPDRGPLFRFEYHLDTDEPVLYDRDIDDLEHGFVASALGKSINSLYRQGMSIEDSRKN